MNSPSHCRISAWALGSPIHARSLLPADVQLDDVQHAAANQRPDDPVELVRSAEALTRTVPIEALPAGSSRVVVGLCDLLREHADAHP